MGLDGENLSSGANGLRIPKVLYWVYHIPANLYYTIIDFKEVDIRIYLPEKVIIHQRPR